MWGKCLFVPNAERGSKGSEIMFSTIQTSEYLSPNAILTIEEQRKLFEIKIRMDPFKFYIIRK